MKSLTTYLTIAVFLFTFFGKFPRNATFADLPTIETSNFACPNVCQVNDSLALIAIYNSTQGSSWSNPWITSQPVCTPWPGVELDDEGYVIRLTLNSNNLTGPLPPEIGNLSRLAELQLDNNNLTGTIPPEIGNLTLMEILFLDDNNFMGSIPDELGNLTMMNTLYLDNNQLTGAVPNSFINLNNLFKFDIFNNMIDSIPDLNMLFLQPNKFRVYNNQLTFDDIVLNDLTALGVYYEPQDSVNPATSVNLLTGSNYILDLDFDNGIIDNSYQWFRNGVPYGTPTNSNKLDFSPVGWSAAGEYRCQVTNPNAPLLTLHTRPVTISVSCGTSVYEIVDTLCHGESIEINSIVYNESNPSGSELLSVPDQYGCDSMIVVNLTFRNENITNLSPTICEGDTVLVNGIVYDINNTNGTETLSIPDQYGCDSIINIDLSFYTAAAAGNLSSIICPGDSIELYGVFYNQTNSTGTVLLENATVTGCDSTLFIEVQFYPPAVGNYNPTICEGGSIVYEGFSFDEDTPSGQVNLGPVSQNGCDSIVNVNVNFFGPLEGTYEETLCNGDSIIIQGTVYNQFNPSGTEFFPNGGTNFCDSIVFVNLSFTANITELLNPVLCNGDSIIVNGVTYNEANPSGNEMMPGGSINGCDSTVIVALDFYPLIESTFDPTLCFGDSVLINGTAYHAANPTGTEIISGGSLIGCDSIVNINLSFYPEYVETLTQSLCAGDSIIVNGITYNESNPSGTETLLGSSNSGCDSVVVIDLLFYNEIVVSFAPTVCQNSSFIINNNTYDFSNPNGTEIIQSNNGCDSIINIDLNFYPNNPEIINDILCAGQSVLVNGITYDESNPSGTEFIPNGSVNGCDSTMIINLSFLPVPEGLLNTVLCPGDNVEINGNTYDENNPNGIEVLQNAGSNGCDSIITIDLDFYIQPQNFINSILCEQDELIVNNQIYNISKPTGTEVIENGGLNGCDSIIIIDLTFNSIIEEDITTTICANDSIIVNNISYNQGNPIGTEIFPNGAANGCDSIVNIALNFFTEAIENINSQICMEDVILVNGISYGFSNQSGIEIIENGSVNGCDSIIDINLSFYPEAQSSLNPIICDGESFELNGNVFDANTPIGNVILEGASSNGCDSTIQVQLSFYDPVMSAFTPTFCAEESIVINGTTYDLNHASGMEVLENASSTGCDSMIQININFLEKAIFETSETICEGMTFEMANNSYSQSGIYEILLNNASADGCDSTIMLNLNVLDAATLGLANAGEDFSQCDDFITLNANLPNGTNGFWTSQDGHIISNPQNPSIDLENIQPGFQSFTWTLSTALCTDYDADTVQIFVHASPDAVDDVFILDAETSLLELDLLENDNFSNVEESMLALLSDPSTGILTEIREGVYTFERSGPLNEELTFEYQLCNEDCPELCDNATVRLSLLKQDINDIEIPNAITPNGDGINETFVFPQLEFEAARYPKSELIIFNRWGDIIYESQPYYNDWNGVDRNGNPLPQGTYYYVLRLDIADGIILKGDVSILK
jgi:gliding motility-associated-like protein